MLLAEAICATFTGASRNWSHTTPAMAATCAPAICSPPEPSPARSRFGRLPARENGTMRAHPFAQRRRADLPRGWRSDYLACLCEKAGVAQNRVRTMQRNRFRCSL